MKMTKTLATIAVLSTASALSHADFKSYERQYKVTITNITKGISFTPFIAATHRHPINVFTLGSPASEEIARIAEGGDIGPLSEVLNNDRKVFDVESSEGLLGPGETVTLELSGKSGRFTLASMLLPTNDTFVGLSDVRLPRLGKVTYLADAYDAGSEMNDEYCTNIPGPFCGGAPFSPEDAGEGYIYPSPGIHGEGDLSRADFNWSGPVASVTIERVW